MAELARRLAHELRNPFPMQITVEYAALEALEAKQFRKCSMESTAR